MQWFQVKEQAAGKKRLIVSWYLYKVFGKKYLYIVAWFVSFFIFVFATNIRKFSKKYLCVIQRQTELKPSLLNQFRHILSYANSLVDKMLVCIGDYDVANVVFETEIDKKQLFDDINKKQGVFFICNHIGNIEILQSYLTDSLNKPDFKINVFLSNRQSRVFNEFLRTIKVDMPVKLFPIEEIGFNTGVELKEHLKKGELVFIAGDRLAENNSGKFVLTELFSHKIKLPKGTFRLAKLMNVPTYFISAVNIDGKYKIIFEKQDDLTEKSITLSYTKFMERIILLNPYQFFHFYDFFMK